MGFDIAITEYSQALNQSTRIKPRADAVPVLMLTKTKASLSSKFMHEMLLAHFVTQVSNVRSRVQKFPATPNGKRCEGYIVPSMVRLMYQLKSVLK